MASILSGTNSSIESKSFARNAGLALEMLVTGPHRDKRIARMFGVSTRMARYLRAGQRWTIERLALASALLGEEFDLLLIGLVPEAITWQQSAEDLIAETQAQLEELLRFERVGKGWDK